MPDSDKDDDWLVVADIADEQHVSEKTVWRWHRDHGLPGYRPGGRNLRFRRSEYVAWLESQRSKVAS